jgi:hypothetical protein
MCGVLVYISDIGEYVVPDVRGAVITRRFEPLEPRSVTSDVPPAGSSQHVPLASTIFAAPSSAPRFNPDPSLKVMVSLLPVVTDPSVSKLVGATALTVTGIAPT